MSEEHVHTHHHSDEISSHDELVAVLQFMAEHNIHHTQELEKIAEKDEIKHSAAALAKINEAVDAYKKGNEALTAALGELKGE